MKTVLILKYVNGLAKLGHRAQTILPVKIEHMADCGHLIFSTFMIYSLIMTMQCSNKYLIGFVIQVTEFNSGLLYDVTCYRFTKM